MQTSTQIIEQGQQVAVVVELFGTDGVTPDTTSVLALTYNSTFLDCMIDATNNRRILVRALAAGTTTPLTVNRAGTAVADPLVIPFQIVPPTDHSKVTLVSVTPV